MRKQWLYMVDRYSMVCVIWYVLRHFVSCIFFHDLDLCFRFIIKKAVLKYLIVLFLLHKVFAVFHFLEHYIDHTEYHDFILTFLILKYGSKPKCSNYSNLICSTLFHLVRVFQILFIVLQNTIAARSENSSP